MTTIAWLNNDNWLMAQTQIPTLTTAHSRIEGGRSQDVVVADAIWETTDGDEADGFKGADRELIELSDIAGTGGVGNAAVMSV